MLEYIEFTNYRCFSKHRVPLRPRTILVGRNNAGKSTVIEGLRFIGLITERYEHLNFHPVPKWCDLPKVFRGIRPALDGFDISLENVFHRYGDPPAEIVAKFSSGASVRVLLGPDGDTHTIITDLAGRPVTTKGEARRVGLPRVSVLPQVAPLSREEDVLNVEYVQRNLSSSLAPLHFRNQLGILYHEHFEDFRRLVESTWPGVRVLDLEVQKRSAGKSQLTLMVQDQDFVAEAGWMGHGLQMWLQTMWFLTRTRGSPIVILDEPDVYMHPDLQRSLVRLMAGRFEQSIVATHSTEILGESEAQDVLILERRRASSSFATSLPAVQDIVENIGSAQNLQLTRLWSARRLLLLEGKDMSVLNRLHKTLYPVSQQPLESVPHMSIGGWSGWNYAVGSSMVLQNAVGERIRVYCLLDSDYHSAEEVLDRKRDAESRGVDLHIWTHKELENYLIVPSAIQRIIKARAAARTAIPTVDEVSKAVNTIAEAMKDDLLDAMANERWLRNRAGGLRAANREARQIVAQAWVDPASKLALVAGKEMLAQLSSWSQENFSVSFGPVTIAQELARSEVHPEVAGVLGAVEAGMQFPPA